MSLDAQGRSPAELEAAVAAMLSSEADDGQWRALLNDPALADPDRDSAFAAMLRKKLLAATGYGAEKWPPKAFYRLSPEAVAVIDEHYGWFGEAAEPGSENAWLRHALIDAAAERSRKSASFENGMIVLFFVLLLGFIANVLIAR